MLYVIGLTVVILKVLVGLGFVIFVHELGHFAVAKLCGVKCEKFYLGFDIGGLKFCKFRYGETEYGIGILPLGGYVKMLGQEDNPAKYREELERAKKEGRTAGDASEASRALFDPRSYLAKSVPQRMAIISAGVIMNLVFAFLMAVVAFGIGAPEPPCVVGEVFAGGAAWQAGLRPDDKVLEIAGQKVEKFRDLQTSVALGNIDVKKGVPFLIERDGKQMTLTIKPDNSLGIFAIGVSGGHTTQLVANPNTWLIRERLPTVPGSSAATTRIPFENSDEFMKIDDMPIDTYGDINRELARKADKNITVLVRRTIESVQADQPPRKELIPIEVAPTPVRHLGMVMEMGPIMAVESDSPAAAAGIQPGDYLVAPNDDPTFLPSRLAQDAGKTVQLTLKRPKHQEPVSVSVKLREPSQITPSIYRNNPIGVPALGIAYRVSNRVERVIPGSPADKAGVKSGDVLAQAKLLAPSAEKLRELKIPSSDESVRDAAMDFGDNDQNWPAFFDALQNTAPGTRVALTVLRNGKKVTLPAAGEAPMELVTSTEAYDPNRGFRFEPMMILSRADSVGEMIKLGGARTWDDVTLVFKSVRALGTGQVPLTGLAGPWTIIKMTMAAADAGTAKFLLFLTFLSANLAVLNFLPIPVLDGGHFVLLAYEGVRGKPASENVQTVLAYIGLALILLLMFWVLGLDFGVFARR